MEDRRLQIRVGLLILLALGILAAFVVILGDFSMGKGFEFYATFSHSGDIATGAAVRVAGIRVGKVKEVHFLEDGKVDPKTGKRMVIRLKLWVEERVKQLLRGDSEIYITARGVLGEKYVGIRPGSASAVAVEPGSTARGLDPPQTDLIAARLFSFVEDLSGMLKRDGHLIRRVLKKGGDALEVVDAILRENRGNISTMITKASSAVDKVSTILDDAKPLVADMRRVLARLNRDLAGSGRVSAILDNVKSFTAVAKREAPAILSSVKTLTGKANRLADKFTTMADDGRGLVKGLSKVVGGNGDKIVRLIDSFLDVGQKARKVMGYIHKMVAKIARGEGSIGALLKDDEIYDNLREMMRQIKQHPWKVLWKD